MHGDARLGKAMTRPRQYSIRILLLLMTLVAHAFSKPSIARTLHTGQIESMSTSTPFLIVIQYGDNKSLNAHSKTYVGAFGLYWLYSHRVTICCGCFRSEIEIKDEKNLDEFGNGSVLSGDCEIEKKTPD